MLQQIFVTDLCNRLLKNGEVDCANQSTLCIVTNTRSGRQTTTIKRQGSNSNYQKTTIKQQHDSHTIIVYDTDKESWMDIRVSTIIDWKVE